MKRITPEGVPVRDDSGYRQRRFQLWQDRDRPVPASDHARPWISLGVDDLLDSQPPPLTDSAGQVYTTLQRLERDGLVESDDIDSEGPQKAFRITATGHHELAGWLRTPSDMSSPPRDELVMKILVALRVPGTDVAEVIQVHRRYLVELMQQWTRIKETGAESDLSLALVVTPGCCGSTRSSAGWTRPTPASSGPPRIPRRPDKKRGKS